MVDDGEGAAEGDGTSHAESSDPSCVVLDEEEIRRRQDEDVAKVSELLSVPRGWACALLRHFRWNTERLHEHWFADEDRVRDAVGFCDDADHASADRQEEEEEELTCGVCLEERPAAEMSSAGCAHRYCGECWRGYIATAVADGPGCLALRCPDPSCSRAVVQETIDRFAVDEDRDRYARFVLRSYVESRNGRCKWCPAPGCTHAIEFLGGAGHGQPRKKDVFCRCGEGLCWGCHGELHRPVDCATFARWTSERSSESQNVDKWMLSHSKPCPECKRPIEKNEGCMHMTCSPPCRHQFCWLCLGPWAGHENNYKCNRYVQEKAKGAYAEEAARRERAKRSLERYLHYHDRWASNLRSRQKAEADLRLLRDGGGLAELSRAQGVTETQLDFVTDASAQVVQCRRVLSWTYVYGYYLSPGSGRQDKARRDLFENLQGQAEVALERLHRCAEREMRRFMPAAAGADEDAEEAKDFGAFRSNLALLTSVTKSYFENLVEALESGLPEVRVRRRRAAPSTNGDGSSSFKKQGDKKKSSGGKRRKRGPNDDNDTFSRAKRTRHH